VFAEYTFPSETLEATSQNYLKIRKKHRAWHQLQR